MIVVVMKITLMNWVVKVKVGIKDRFMVTVKAKNNVTLFDGLLLGD